MVKGVTGLPNHPVENISPSNIYMRFAGSGTLEDAGREVKDSPVDYPERINFEVTPAFGINCQHVNEIQLDRVKVVFLHNDDRAPFFLKIQAL